MQEQTPFKVLFGCGIKTATAVANEVFTPKVGTVRDPESKSAATQREIFVQKVKNLRPRHIVVWRLGDRLRFLQTIAVPAPDVTSKQLESVKVKLLKRNGVPVEQGGKNGENAETHGDTSAPPSSRSGNTSFLG